MSPRIQRRSLTVRYADYKALVNNSDFKCFLEVGSEPLSLCWAGNEFHTVGAATERARSVRVRWVCRCRVSTDRDEREDVTGWSRSDRYDSVEDARILYVRYCDVCFMVRIRVTSHWRVSSPGSMGNGIGSTNRQSIRRTWGIPGQWLWYCLINDTTCPQAHSTQVCHTTVCYDDETGDYTI